jgi:hypothetical protein
MIGSRLLLSLIRQISLMRFMFEARFNPLNTFLFGLAVKRLATHALLALACVYATNAAAQETENESWWQRTKNSVFNIASTGKPDLYLSGYAYHSPRTYTPERRAELNHDIWGGGFGKSIRNAKGNDESLYLMVISDSHKAPQSMLGYAYQWMWPMGHTGIEAGLGVTGLLTSRVDYFSGVPFPIILPVGSLGTEKVKLTFSYVPRLSGNKGNGDVLLVFLRIGME